MKHSLITVLIAVNVVLLGVICGCSQPQQTVDHGPTFAEVHDWYKVEEPIGFVKAVEIMEAKQAELEAKQAEEVEAEEEYYEEYYYEEYYEPAYYSGDGFQQQGVREGVDSETETWYSSVKARHEDTDQWSVDDEGYYRTDEGYYVIASNDYEKGTVINTSKGEAQVLDDGTDSGNADFYVAW